MIAALRDATVTFGSTRALDDVSFTLNAGEVTALVGGDGAGKTTALRAVLGRVRLDSGAAHAPEPRNIGYQPATGGVWGHLSVDENLEFVGAAYGMPGTRVAERARAVLEAAGLTEARSRLGARLSGGMRQKLGFCMAVLHEPALLLLDEPSTGVDPVSRVELWRLIAETAAAGTAVALATTYLDEAERATTVVALDRGSVIAAGDAAAIRERVPGSITIGLQRPARAASRVWRRGTEFHAWAPDPGDGTGGTPVDLEDALIATTIARTDAATDVPGLESHIEPIDHDDAPLVVASGVTKRFGKFAAVAGMNLEVSPGEIVGLLGANGAGKTTLLRMLLGLDAASVGDIRVLNAAPSAADRHALGYVSQGLGLWNELSVEQNIAFIAESFGVDRVPPLPEALRSVRDERVGSIGLGRQRQLAFYCALVHRPRLLVLDEPTSGVDPLARARLWDTIHAQADAGVGVIVTTHYMQEAAQCSRLVIMSHGRAVARGTTREIIAGSRAIAVEADDWAGAFSALGAADLPVILDGRASRVAGAEEAAVRRALDTAGVAASLSEVPATLEETMLLIETGARVAAA